MTAETRSIIEGFIAVVIGVLLVPVISSTAASANVTGNVALIVSLIPLLFALGILLVQVRKMS